MYGKYLALAKNGTIFILNSNIFKVMPLTGFRANAGYDTLIIKLRKYACKPVL